MDADFGAWEAEDPDLSGVAFPCLNFAGTASPNQYAELPCALGGFWAQGCTIEALVRPTAIASAASLWAWICHDNDGVWGDVLSHGMNVLQNGGLRAHAFFPSGSTGSFGPATTQGIVDNAWRRLQFVAGGPDGDVAYYLDSVLIGSRTSGGDPWGPLERIYLGLRDPAAFLVGGDTGADWTGQISDVRVWTFARTVAQMAADAYYRLVGDEPGLARYWPLDDAAGVTLRELVAGASGTVVNATWTTVTGQPVADAEQDVLVGRRALERKVSVGLKAYGRWNRPRIRHAQLDEQFGIEWMRLSGSYAGNHPSAL
jgi:hypothetical protein